MRGLAKYVLIVVSCLSAASSMSHPTTLEGVAPAATAAGRGGLAFDLIQRARHEMPAATRVVKQAATAPEIDTWLAFALGIGLVCLQLRRKQKSLRSARMLA